MEGLGRRVIVAAFDGWNDASEAATSAASVLKDGVPYEPVFAVEGDGRYRADWVEPETGKVLAAQTLDHADGRVKLTSPRYSVDLALRVVRMD